MVTRITISRNMDQDPTRPSSTKTTKPTRYTSREVPTDYSTRRARLQFIIIHTHASWCTLLTSASRPTTYYDTSPTNQATPGPSRRACTLSSAGRRPRHAAAAAAEVANGLELVGRGFGGRARDGDLDVVAVPAVVRAGAVGGQPHSARRLRHAGPAAAEDVQVAALEVVVALPHEPAPRRAGPRSPRRCRPRRPATT